ncbi:uroporphyrinogen-III synthase [Halomonas sp. H5]|uniref:uroporphyrinogen-III synthase n=1 Tax=Halomonas sp. H5 TaxID=3423910 RepID=UPI003D35F848
MSQASRVLITRPGERARPLREALDALGAESVALEVMRLEALPETQAQRSAWLDFDAYRHVIVVSPFAADCLAEALDRYWPQLPLGPRFYAVGAATAERLHRHFGVRVRVPPPGQGDTSEALLTLAGLRSLSEQKVLLVAGEGGRPLLAETLGARGARVTRLALYRRQCLPPAPEAAVWLARGEYRALVVTSGELLEHLAPWCGEAALNQPLIVSSPRLATLAGSLGFTKLHTATGATPAALAAAVAGACNLDGAEPDHDDLDKG